MSTSTAVAARPQLRLDIGDPVDGTVNVDARRIAFRTSGRTHGPITRLVSPSDPDEWTRMDESRKRRVA
ncbi:MAG: hypothetical protein WD795_19275 [Woeseia sp.]